MPLAVKKSEVVDGEPVDCFLENVNKGRHVDMEQGRHGLKTLHHWPTKINLNHYG